MNNVNPADINRIENFLKIKVNEIEQLETDNYTVRIYSINKQDIIVIDNGTNECYKMMG